MSSWSNVNETAWSLGWSPIVPIGGGAIVGGGIGVLMEEVFPLFGMGLIFGIALWYWGVQEINNNYQQFIQDYINSSERYVVEQLVVDGGSTYSLPAESGKSPPLVEPSRTYYNNIFVISDASVNINDNVVYDMKRREIVNYGTNVELYFDQISELQTNKGAHATSMKIMTSSGSQFFIHSWDVRTVNAVVSELRDKVRQAKRQTHR